MTAAPLDRLEDVVADLLGGVPIPQQAGMPIERAEATAARLGWETRVSTPAPGEVDWLLTRAVRRGPVLVIDTRAGAVTGLQRGARIPSPELAAWADREQAELDPATEALLEGLSPARRTRAGQVGTARERGAIAALAVVQFTPLGEGPLRRAAARLLGAVSADAADVAMAIAGWWLLGALAFRGGDGSGWLIGWGLLVVLRVVVGTGAGWARAVAFQGLAEGWRRRIMHRLLEPRNGRQIDEGTLTGGLAEIEHVEEAGHDAVLGGVLGSIEIVAAVVVLSVGAAPAAGWAAVGLAGLILVAVVPSLVRSTEAWSVARVAATRRMLDDLAVHRLRLVFGDSKATRERQIETLDRYALAGRNVDRAALLATIVPVRVVLVAGLLGLLPAVLSGVQVTQLAIAIGGVLLAGSGMGRLGGAASALADARAALRRLDAIIEVGPDPAPTRPETVPALVPARPASRLELEIPGNPSAEIAGVDRGAKVRCATSLEQLAWTDPGGQRPGSGRATRSPRLDGVPREVIDQAAWARRVGLIRGDDTIFAGTLAWNLLAGSQWPPGPADLDRAEAICRALELDAVALTEEGLRLWIGEGGRGVSEGERARIVLARAILRDPDFLVLCDPLEMLDPPLRAAVASHLEAESGAVLVAGVASA